MALSPLTIMAIVVANNFSYTSARKFSAAFVQKQNQCKTSRQTMASISNINSSDNNDNNIVLDTIPTIHALLWSAQKVRQRLYGVDNDALPSFMRDFTKELSYPSSYNMDITDSKSILRRNKKTVERGFCNWIIPQVLIQGQYPGMTPESYGPSSKECQVHIQNMIQQAKVTCFCCLQTEVPSQDDDIGWKHGEVYLDPEYVRRQFPRPFTRYGKFAQSLNTATQITFIHQPIEDLDVPNNDSLLSLLMRLLQHLEDDNSTIYLHCWGGRGRAGLIGSCLTILLFPELSSCDILNWIQKGYESRAGAESMSEGLKRSPQTAQQRQFVKDFVDIVHREIVEEYPTSTC